MICRADKSATRTEVTSPPRSVQKSPSAAQGHHKSALLPSPVVLLPALLLLLPTAEPASAAEPTTPRQSPPFASCLLVQARAGQTNRTALGLVRAGAVYDELAQGSQNTLQIRSAGGGNRSQPARDQVAFASVCNGWTNSIQANVNQPPAFWALDQQRGLFVAKFIFYSPAEYTDISSREARLTSPVFRPIPIYHFRNESRYYQTCNVSYSAYLTMNAQLDLHLLTVASTRGARERVLPLDSLSLSKSEASRLLSRPRPEPDLWRRRTLSLPVEALTWETFFSLQFSAMPTLVSSHATHQQLEYLNGVAIRNISLTPQCFGLQVDPEELERLHRITGIDPLHFADQANPRLAAAPDSRSQVIPVVSDFIDAHKAPIFLLILLCLSVVLVCQYLLCAVNGERLQKQRKQVGFWRFCCWCGLMRADRKRVYAAQAAQQQVQRPDSLGAKLHQKELDQETMMRNLYLCPLQTMLENIELNENPNYLSNGGLGTPNSTLPMLSMPASLQVRVHQLHIDRKKLTLTRRLGKGAFGEVYQGYLLYYYNNYQEGDEDNTGSGGNRSCQMADDDQLDQMETVSRKVAVKTLTDERTSQEDFVREALNMSQVKHRNIVELIGVCFDEKPLYIVMELLPGGNLKNFLRNNRHKSRSLSPQNHHQQPLLGARPAPSPAGSPDGRTSLCMGDLLVIALDVARACDYLQRNQFIHRDLAARNCLLSASHKRCASWFASSTLVNLPSTPDEQPDAPADFDPHQVDLNEVYLSGYAGSGIVTKLADFGLTRDVCANDYYRTMGHKEIPVRWMPPEILDGVATTKSDVWSFGVFLWELFSMGQQPYQNLLDNEQVIEFIKKRRHAAPLALRKPELLLTISDESVNNNTLIDRSSDRADLLRGSGNNPHDEEPLHHEAPLDPPLPKPHFDTPEAVYSIMCACWATNPEDRPQFDQVARELLCCLQMEEVLATSLPCFYEQPPASAAQFPPRRAGLQSTPVSVVAADHNGADQRGQRTPPPQLNWWCP